MLSKVVIWIGAWLTLVFIGACVGIILPWNWLGLFTVIYLGAEVSLGLISLDLRRTGRSLSSMPPWILRWAPFVAAWMTEYLKYY